MQTMGYILKNRIKEHRARRNISQTILAEEVGITRVTMGNIETGKAAPSFIVAWKLAEAFEVAIEELFTLETK